jgi:hypothetical protein
MNRLLTPSLAVVTLALAVPAAAQKPRPAVKPAPKPVPRVVAPAPPALSGDAAVVARRCEELENKINSHDIASVRAYFHPELRVKGTKGTTQKYKGVVASMAQTFRKYPRFRTYMAVEGVHVKDGKAHLTARYENRGLTRTPERGRCTMIWKRHKGQWVLASMTR